MNIPLLDLKREYEFLKKDIKEQLEECLKLQQWILGDKVVEFEKKAAKYLGAKYTVGVASGTDALVLSLRALALKNKNKQYFDKKDEIITTPFTFIATAEAIVRSGATPVFVDIDPDTFNIDPNQIKKAITKNTTGILPVHLYGLACDMGKISKIAKENNLFVVEDVAQAFGGIYRGKKLGTWGDTGTFSFFPSKNLAGFGDGGLIATNDSKLADLAKILRNHGQNKRYKAAYIGYNSRLDSIQAGVLLAKLRYIDKFNESRRKIAQGYNNALKNIKQIKCPLLNTQYSILNTKHIYHLYTIKVSSRRDILLNYLHSRKISSRIYYPLPLHRMKAFRSCKCRGILKNTKEASVKALTLPLHPFLKDKEADYVISAIRKFYQR